MAGTGRVIPQLGLAVHAERIAQPDVQRSQAHHPIRVGPVVGEVARDVHGVAAIACDQVATVDDVATKAAHALEPRPRIGGHAGVRQALADDHAPLRENRVAAVGAALGKHQGATASLGQATGTADGVAEYACVQAVCRIHALVVELDQHVAPVKAAGALDRSTDVEQAVAEYDVRADLADVGRRAENRLPDQVVVEIGKRLPDQRSRTCHQRRGIGGAAAPLVGGVARRIVVPGEHHVAGSREAIAHRHAAGLRIVGQRRRGFRRVQCGHREPAALQKRRLGRLAG